MPARGTHADLNEVARALGRRQMLSVLLEAGATLNGAALAARAAPQAPQLPDNFVSGDHASILYNQAPLHDPATKLAPKLASGQIKLEYRKDGSGYLASLLKALGVNPDSQALVFSKTSFQATRISPANPRAIYFSDDVFVGFVKGSDLLEVAATDPRQGVIFYSFDQHQNPPRFDRRDVCLQCHQSPGTLGVPGLMVASVYPDASGMPAFRGAQLLTDHRSKIEDRWGGWYVTGTHGDMRHNGNAVGHDSQHPELLDRRDTQNLTTLAKRFNQSGYLSGLSDIVALMTLEHQTRMTNLIIRVGWEARMLQHEGPAAPATLRKQYETDADNAAADRVLTILLSECSVKQAAALAAQITGRKKNALYERALQLKG